MGQLWLWLYSVLATFGCGCILNKPTDELIMLVYYCVDVSIIIFVMLGSMPTGFVLVVKNETLPGVPNRHVGIGNPANEVVILMPEKKEGKKRRSNCGNAWLKNLKKELKKKKEEKKEEVIVGMHG